MCFLIRWSWVQGGPPPEALGGSNVGRPQRRQEPEPPQARRAPHQSEGGACGEMADEGCQVIAAVYARLSKEDTRTAGDNGTARQLELGRGFVVKNGWTVNESYVLADAGVSGANFDHRPGLVRLLEGARQKPHQGVKATASGQLAREQQPSI